MLIQKKVLIDKKDKWVLKQDTEDFKWTLYKNGKKIKTSKYHNKLAELMPDYK